MERIRERRASTLFEVEREKRWRIWLLFGLLLVLAFVTAWVACLIVSVSRTFVVPRVGRRDLAVHAARRAGRPRRRARRARSLYWWTRAARRSRPPARGACTAGRSTPATATTSGSPTSSRRCASPPARRASSASPCAPSGFNAFAFSDLHGGGVIGVTEGALARLSRQQLQAVVAHEFAHILSGSYVDRHGVVPAVRHLLVARSTSSTTPPTLARTRTRRRRAGRDGAAARLAVGDAGRVVGGERRAQPRARAAGRPRGGALHARPACAGRGAAHHRAAPRRGRLHPRGPRRRCASAPRARSAGRPSRGATRIRRSRSGSAPCSGSRTSLPPSSSGRSAQAGEDFARPRALVAGADARRARRQLLPQDPPPRPCLSRPAPVRRLAAGPAAAGMTCPSCGAGLVRAPYEGIDIALCERCGGRLVTTTRDRQAARAARSRLHRGAAAPRRPARGRRRPPAPRRRPRPRTPRRLAHPVPQVRRADDAPPLQLRVRGRDRLLQRLRPHLVREGRARGAAGAGRAADRLRRAGGRAHARAGDSRRLVL